MSNLQIIEELCAICSAMARIISEQRKALAQLDALVMEKEIAETRSRYTGLLGDGEWPEPDTTEQQEEQAQ